MNSFSRRFSQKEKRFLWKALPSRTKIMSWFLLSGLLFGCSPSAPLVVSPSPAESATPFGAQSKSQQAQSESQQIKATPGLSTNTALCGQLPAPLTAAEKAYAQTAWQYFENNRQPQTGLINAADSYPSGTLWDQGNYVSALNAALWLGLIEASEFDQQLTAFLTGLKALPLFEETLPNKVYNSATGEMVDYGNQPTTRGLGWSALDIGRMLTALHIVRTCHPQYAAAIESVVAAWQLDKSIADGMLYGATVLADGKTQRVQEGRLGYEEYAARGYGLWGFDAPEALKLTPMKSVKLEGVSISVDSRDFATTDANNYVVSESYILEGIEFGLNDSLSSAAQSLLTAQENRFKRTGKLTAVSEDNIDQPPHFLYNTAYANGQDWAVITDKNQAYPQLRTLSTKAAFGWHYLFPDHAYAQQVFAVAKDLQDPDGKGFYAGQYESNEQPNKILTGNTNGLILEILYYKARGNRAILDSTL
jgi:hypothetical protein